MVSFGIRQDFKTVAMHYIRVRSNIFCNLKYSMLVPYVILLELPSPQATLKPQAVLPKPYTLNLFQDIEQLRKRLEVSWKP